MCCCVRFSLMDQQALRRQRPSRFRYVGLVCNTRFHARSVSMPCRIAVDKDAVVAAHKRLGNSRAVARELGVRENTVYQIMRVHRGICRSCKRPLVPGRQHCQECLDRLSERISEKYVGRKRKGIGRYCDDPIAPPSQTVCLEHREKHRHRRQGAELIAMSAMSRLSSSVRLGTTRSNGGNCRRNEAKPGKSLPSLCLRSYALSCHLTCLRPLGQPHQIQGLDHGPRR
jgi:hypothetical protein